MSQYDGGESTTRDNEGSVVFEEARGQLSGNIPPIAFVHTTGPIVKNARVQRSIRNFVMRDYGRARRRTDKGKSTEKPVTTESVPAVPKLTVVANASPEYFGSVQLVKAAQDSHCAFPGCMELPTPTLRHLTHEGGPFYCSNHLQVTLSGSNTVPSISRFSTGRIDPFVPYPITMTPRVRQLVDYVFTDTPNRNIKFYRDTIFPTALVGGITFYQVLANLALYLRHARPLESAEGYEMREELAYQARVFQLVNEKIAKKEATSEDVISAVAALACQSHVARDLRMFHMHMRGLKAIIAMRGGIQTLDSNDIVRHSLYWLDVNGNSTEDNPPAWPIPLSLVPYRPALPQTITPPSTALLISATWRRLYPSQTLLLDIFDDTARFGIHLGKEEARTAGHVYTDVVFAGNLIIGLVHRLLSARQAVDPECPETVFAEATRLALLLFLAEIRRRFGLHPIDSRAHVQKLQYVLEKDGADWTPLGPLRLWIVSMGVLEAAEEPEAGWLVGEWARRAFSGDMTTAGQAERLFQSVMWIDTVHGVIFREKQERFSGTGPVLAPKP